MFIKVVTKVASALPTNKELRHIARFIAGSELLLRCTFYDDFMTQSPGRKKWRGRGL